MEAWTDFGVAIVGASAALTGLLFVALSINLREILQDRALTSRALLTLLLLVVPLVSTMLLLVPQATTAYGVELVVVGVLFGAWMTFLSRPSARTAGQSAAARFTAVVLPVALVAAGTIAAGVLLVLHHPAGMYALLAAVIAAFFGALTSTWVLLVEILR